MGTSSHRRRLEHVNGGSIPQPKEGTQMAQQSETQSAPFRCGCGQTFQSQAEFDKHAQQCQDKDASDSETHEHGKSCGCG